MNVTTLAGYPDIVSTIVFSRWGREMPHCLTPGCEVYSIAVMLKPTRLTAALLTGLEIEPQTLRLKAPQAVQQPVVLLDQHWVDTRLGSDQTDPLPSCHAPGLAASRS